MSKIFGKMVKNERYFLDYFLFLICLAPVMGAICSLQDLQYISIHALPGSATLHRLKHNKDVSTFQFMRPAMGAT